MKYRFLTLLLICTFIPWQVRASSCAHWPLWQDFTTRFISADGRVVDHSTAVKQSTSEGQSYALFFALVANDRRRFEQLLNWTNNNLADGDLSAKLPAWQWGQRHDGSWGILDDNAAADSDVWLAYVLTEAGRLWREPRYSATGKLLAARILREETADPRRRHDPVFASHPKTSERLEDMRAAAARVPPGDYERHQARYAAAVRPHLAAWLDAELGKRTFATSIQMIEDLKRAAAPELLGTYEFYLAEALRRRNRNDDRERADALYASAVGRAETPAGAWREYGLVLKRRGQAAEAATHLRRYLEREPTAKDRLFIEKDIQSLENRP